MTDKWYLMNTNYDTVSGFESDDFNDFAEDAFLESLDSNIGESVEICNCDLSEKKSTRVIVQGSTPDTKLKSMQRTILAPIGSLKAGYYVHYKNRYWLIIGLVDNNGIYEKAVAVLCNYLLTWINGRGKIIQRWINAASASQYNNGETSTNNYFVRSDQLMILTPDDDECLLIKHSQRFVIDRRHEVYERNFDDNTLVDTSNDLITYELTRMDNVLFDYQDSGHSEFMAYQCEQHESDGYYVVGGKGYWLCDVPGETDKTGVLSCSIECDDPVVYSGLESTTFRAKFLDSQGAETVATPLWEVVCDFKDSLSIESAEDYMRISVNRNDLIGKNFKLSLSADGYKPCNITITIRAFI